MANRLFELGLRGVETEDRDGRVILRAYCDDETAARSYGERLAPYLASLRAMWPELADLQLRYAPVERQDWATAWKAYFKPARVTDRLVVRPSWESFDPAPGDKVLIIDPAMAFGTGTHETTRLALGAIDRFSRAEPALFSTWAAGPAS
ncbi:MAG: 50S ribosomal protein L11 methyltransferase [Deltaproteobacteria bacterium]|nr:50S ribosomal protein L11 methyltransferase [Deltaproteobacteria bacterium]